jgi:hypothetical protein
MATGPFAVKDAVFYLPLTMDMTACLAVARNRSHAVRANIFFLNCLSEFA